MTNPTPTGGLDVTALTQSIIDAQSKVATAIKAMQDKGTGAAGDPAAMFALQNLMNALQQTTEMVGSAIAASQSMVMGLARNIKG